MEDRPRRLLDQAMPAWDVAEQHQRLVRATPDEVWRALLATTVGDLPLTRVLMRARALGRNPLGDADRPVLEALPPGELARHGTRDLLLGLVVPTSLRTPVATVQHYRPATVEELRRALPDGWVRIAMDFRLLGAGGETTLSTETRVLASGPRARMLFRLYWLPVRAGSGLVRRELLRAVARRAEVSGA